jgi:hypothetical protein
MSKHFFMQYYPVELLSDAKVSQCRADNPGYPVGCHIIHAISGH